MGYRIISCALTAPYLTSGDNNTLKATVHLRVEGIRILPNGRTIHFATVHSLPSRKQCMQEAEEVTL